MLLGSCVGHCRIVEWDPGAPQPEEDQFSGVGSSGEALATRSPSRSPRSPQEEFQDRLLLSSLAVFLATCLRHRHPPPCVCLSLVSFAASIALCRSMLVQVRARPVLAQHVCANPQYSLMLKHAFVRHTSIPAVGEKIAHPCAARHHAAWDSHRHMSHGCSVGRRRSRTVLKIVRASHESFATRVGIRQPCRRTLPHASGTEEYSDNGPARCFILEFGWQRMLSLPSMSNAGLARSRHGARIAQCEDESGCFGRSDRISSGVSGFVVRR